MAFQFEQHEKVRPAVRRIARAQLRRAKEVVEAALREGATRDEVDTAVHEARKRCKQVRGLVRLVRPCFDGYGDTNAAVRDAASLLGALRDATTVLETFDRLIDGQDAARFDPLRQTLVRDRAERGSDESATLRAFVERVRDIRDGASKWKLSQTGFDALGPGLEQTYARCQSAMEAARTEPTTENLHDWRKRVKYNRCHLRLLRGLWEPVIEPMREEARRLGDLLGEEHDLAVLGETLRGDSGGGHAPMIQELTERISEERERRRAAAFELGARLYAPSPDRYARHARALWDASHG